ncbi:PEP-utilizing enzyme [Thermopolyspora sp. NPDC052614]|uniref:PEP-utilizing enzyme n=1 Tax=Thermopolyspora sp. NPDC052614 TaxID=3155682 RepID=UPI0034308290
MRSAPATRRALSVFPADEPWYPHGPEPGEAVAWGKRGGEPPAVLAAGDLRRSWHLDFHQPRGVVPLGTGLVADLADGAQRAAEELRLEHTGGLAVRFVGPHVYLGTAPAGRQPAAEVERARAAIRRYPEEFPRAWQAARSRLETALTALQSEPLHDRTPAELGEYLKRAWAVHADAWRVHFAVMYRLLLCHEMLRAELAEAGVGEELLTSVLQSAGNRVLATDRMLHALARRARDDGLAGLFEAEGALLPRLAAHPPAAGWLAYFNRFIRDHGHRADAPGDLTRPSWREDPEQVVSLLRPVVLGDTPLPDAAPGLAEIGRDGAWPTTGVRVPNLSDTAAALVGEAVTANVVEWNEDHNLVIDLRAHLPVRAAALALAAATGAPAADEVLFLFPAEAMDLAHGVVTWGELAGRTAARREYHRSWLTCRAALPRKIGDGGDETPDPVIAQILCADVHRLPLPDRPLALTGLGVSRGVATGPVRVIRSADALSAVRPGDVLVCEATSPSWTPVFNLLTACVCDTGGMLTHAAAVSREYGIPCVCDVRTATTTLRDGDVVEVNGTTGVVTILSRRDGTT